MLSIFLEYSIDAAHWLPNVPVGHKCGNMHGHRYDVRIELGGEPDPTNGWILDYADARIRIDPFIDKLDHAIPKVDNPTCENITLFIRDWLWSRNFAPSRIEVRETDRAGCVWTN